IPQRRKFDMPRSLVRTTPSWSTMTLNARILFSKRSHSENLSKETRSQTSRCRRT
ncbi:hypothetical protein FRC19_002656, partial [Serendipita sp. 401]